MTSRAKKRLFNVFRITLCVAALAIVIQGVTIHDHITPADRSANLVGIVVDDDPGAESIVLELSEGQREVVKRSDIATDESGAPEITYGLISTWRKAGKWYLLLAVVIHFFVVFPQALRFQWMLRVQGIMVGYWESLKLAFAGNFLNFATPLGSNAGDVFKAYFVSLHTDRKTEAVTTVVLDRIVGLVSLLIVVAAITTFSPSDSRLAAFKFYFLAMLGIGLVAAVLYLAPPVRRRLVPWSWLSRLPMFEQLQRIDRTARVLAGSPLTLVNVFLLTVFLQAMAIGAYFTVAVALGLTANRGNVLEYYTYFYTGVLIQALPGPPQGLGTVELAYRYFLAPFGSPSQIICVAFAIRLVVLTVALPGLLVTLTGSYKPRMATAGDEAAPDTGDASAEAPPAAEKHELVTS
ncbi:MAG: flippase-like domain-containing protein [Planctomycetes bacterium]|nr:flippase-like domain-containing protein [Planctomycetota bacterium]